MKLVQNKLNGQWLTGYGHGPAQWSADETAAIVLRPHIAAAVAMTLSTVLQSDVVVIDGPPVDCTVAFFGRLNADLLLQQSAIETEFRERPELTLEDIDRETACYEDFIRVRFRAAAARGIETRND